MNLFSPYKSEVNSPAVRPGPSTGMTLVLIVLSLLLIAATVRAHQVEIINSFSVTNYTGYVIDSDAQWGLADYNREDILARAVVQYSTTNNFQTIYNYQIVFRLLDGTNAVLLRMTNGTTNTDGGLTAKGIVTQPDDLTWGWIGLPAVQRYAHRVQAFTEAGFHMPGFFLRGDQTSQATTNRPAVLLYTGIGTGDLHVPGVCGRGHGRRPLDDQRVGLPLGDGPALKGVGGIRGAFLAVERSAPD